MSVGLILAAAGSGQRLGGTPKQVRALAGRPVLCWSLAAFAGLIDHAVIVTRSDLVPLITGLMTLEQPGHGVSVITGGDTRQASVIAGLNALPSAVDRVLVHDAARPLITPVAIQACLLALDHAPAAVLASPCHATLKRADASGCLVAETIDRSGIFLAQTPQAFHRAAGEQAFAQAQAQGYQATDDVALLEQAGLRVALVHGPSDNLKITDDADWAMAEALMLYRMQV